MDLIVWYNCIWTVQKYRKRWVLVAIHSQKRFVLSKKTMKLIFKNSIKFFFLSHSILPLASLIIDFSNETISLAKFSFFFFFTEQFNHRNSFSILSFVRIIQIFITNSLVKKKEGFRTRNFFGLWKMVFLFIRSYFISDLKNTNKSFLVIMHNAICHNLN